MRELNVNEIQDVNGGILPAFILGAALGRIAKKLYDKYVD